MEKICYDTFEDAIELLASSLCETPQVLHLQGMRCPTVSGSHLYLLTHENG